jgi:hypothetical protein
MAAYKQFNSQDIIVSPLEVNKGFTFAGDALTGSDVGIDRFIGKSGDFLNTQTTTGKISASLQYEVLIYDSIKQLYYSNYISGSYGEISQGNTASFNTDGTITGPIYQTSYYNYEQTTLNPSKLFPTSSGEPIGVISIPSKIFGDYIQPNSFELVSPVSGTIRDDGEGRLNLEFNNKTYPIGNIIYQHGLAIITEIPLDEVVTGSASLYGSGIYGSSFYGGIAQISDTNAFLISTNVTCSFSSSYTIYETQYKCTIGESEFNYTLNPTVLSGSEGDLYNQFTGSYFDPYLTTVGMYNENYELLAVGKLAKPLPTSRTTDTTILINIDR